MFLIDYKRLYAFMRVAPEFYAKITFFVRFRTIKTG